MIEPRTLKGFRDHLPAQALARERVLDTARRVYRMYGFAPIDTPALEYLEILLGKGSEETDRQLYRFRDHGGRDVGMRFDLTVPFARFAAQHLHDLALPFKRYQMAPVWRGENTQRGRYREFMQCDFDTIGTTSPVADLETVLVVHDLLDAIGIERFTIRVNDRRVLRGILERLGLGDGAGVLRSLDKLAKAGPDTVAAELTGQGVSAAAVAELLDMARLRGQSDEVLGRLERLVGQSSIGAAGVSALRAVSSGARAAGIPEHRLAVDPSIARGLDYYTGLVIESFLDDLPGLGSICSGGRYDDLAGLYTKQPLPGVGASLGLDRLLAGLEELGMGATAETPADVFLVHFDTTHLEEYLRIASALRAAGTAVEFFPEARRVGHQLKLAAKRGFPAALIIGSEEFARGTAQFKHLASQTSSSIDWHGDLHVLVDAVRSFLAAGGPFG
jgi:histidyl-tRNA synthetase